MGTDLFLSQVIDIQSGYPGVYCLLHLAEYIRQNLTRFSHQIKFTL